MQTPQHSTYSFKAAIKQSRKYGDILVNMILRFPRESTCFFEKKVIF